MKKMTRGIVFLLVACATSVIYGAQPARGVAGVDVFVKQNPSKRAMTDARGNFAFDGLPAGSYTLMFRAKKAQDTKTQSTTNVTVATSYSIQIQGVKRVTKSGLTSNDLIGGFELRVDGAGSKIHGQVAADALKKMVWIPQEPGSHIPGRWVAADSPEAKRAFKSNAYGQSGDGLRRMMDRAGDEAEPGSPAYYNRQGR
jgi:Carboxypeptidase regulatory-like domain